MVRFSDPTLMPFLEGLVAAGRYPSVEAAIVAAVQLMKDDRGLATDLDESTIAAIDEAEAQVARGDFYTSDQVKAMAAELQAKRA